MKRILLGFFALCGLTACGEPDTRPRTSVSVVIDLSTSWVNAFTAEESIEDLVAHLGHGVADVTERLPGPVDIRFYAITSESMTEPVLCHKVYQQSIVVSDPHGDPERSVFINDRYELVEHFKFDCPAKIAARVESDRLKFEKSGGRDRIKTDIEGALVRVLEETRSINPDHSLTLMISDFVWEDEYLEIDWSSRHAAGHNILLFFRNTQTDPASNSNPYKTEDEWMARIEEWGFCARSVRDRSPVFTTVSAWLWQQYQTEKSGDNCLHPGSQIFPGSSFASSAELSDPKLQNAN